MQTVPNWQAIAQNYYFAQNSAIDTFHQKHLNSFSTPTNLYYQKEAVVSYHKSLRKKYPNGAIAQLQCRKMAEAQFGQFLIGIV